MARLRFLAFLLLLLLRLRLIYMLLSPCHANLLPPPPPPLSLSRLIGSIRRHRRSMALRLPLVTAAVFFFVAFALASLDVSVCHVVKGKVSCLDCKRGHDLSGIKVMVKCKEAKKASTATTEDDGSLEVELPFAEEAATGGTATAPPLNCLAKVLGGPDQLYASRDQMVAEVVKVKGHDGAAASYALSAPLAVSTSCPPSRECGAHNTVGSSKTIDVPIPREWGLAPSSYYVPFFPIIGIP